MVRAIHWSDVPRSNSDRAAASACVGDQFRLSKGDTSGIFACCCAWAFTPTASCTTTRIDTRTAFFIAYLVLKQTYHADGNCKKRYLREKGNQFRRGAKG